MADDPVVNIYGIGKVTSEALKNHGVTTVGQLANLEPNDFKIANLAVLISRAKDYVKQRAKPEETDDRPTVTLGSDAAKSMTRPEKPKIPATTLPSIFATKLKPTTATRSTAEGSPIQADTTKAAETPKTVKPEKQEEHKSEKFLISDHTWYETRVVVPRDDSLCEAIVYEISVEPHDRVAFVCTWVTPPDPEEDEKAIREGKERLHTMTYSPQLLLHFNIDLPPLNVSIRDEDFQTMPNRHALLNALWEVGMMQKQLH